MSTNATISLVNSNDSVDQIYLHWDGYTAYAGKTLARHYTTIEKVRELINLGAISSLGAEIGEKHTFDQRPEDVCTAYGRDRGDRDTEAQRFRTYKAWENKRRVEQYNYLFKDGQWFVSSSNNKTWLLIDEFYLGEGE